MPTLSVFFGIVIRMYFDDHPPPHFHAIYGEHEVKIAIETLAAIEGGLPQRAFGLVLEWAELHSQELSDNWARGQEHERMQRIEPLPYSIMNRIVTVSAGNAYTLEVAFSDGTSGKVDLSSRLFGPMFEPLRDSSLFSQVHIDEFGAVCWPNGADLAPDALYRAILSSADERNVLAS